MTRWCKDVAEASCLHHATEDGKSDEKERTEREGRSSAIDTAADECRNEVVDRVARYLFD